MNECFKELLSRIYDDYDFTINESDITDQTSGILVYSYDITNILQYEVYSEI